MPLGIVSDSDFDSEMSNIGQSDSVEKNSIGQVKQIERGRGVGNLEVPMPLRKIISDEAIESGNGPANKLAQTLSISPSSVSAYKNGSTSTASYNEPSDELQRHTTDKRIRISNKAKSRLLHTINQITPEKLAEAKLKDLASVASALSGVVRNLEPEKRDDNKQVQFIVFAPKIRAERDFEVIDVME